MHPTFAGVFDDAENRYLSTDSLKEIHRYVKSVPHRLNVYRTLRDHEAKIMQVVADRLVADFGETTPEVTIERSVTNGLLVVRHCAMAMLLDNAQQLEPQLLGWLRESMQIHGTEILDVALYRYLRQVLTKAMNPQQLALIDPLLIQAQGYLTAPTDAAIAPARSAA
jgi:Phycobilisome protein